MMMFTKQNGEKVQIRLYVEPGRLTATGKIYRLLDESGVEVGLMTTCIGGYIDKTQNSDSWIEINMLSNHTHDNGDNRINGIGKFLIQQAIANSNEIGLGGHVQLTASYDSHLFYYKLGFRPRPDVDKIFLGSYYGDIYNKVKNNILLEGNEAIYYEILKENAALENKFSLDEIFHTTYTEKLEKLYQKYLITGEYNITYGLGSLIMYFCKKIE